MRSFRPALALACTVLVLGSFAPMASAAKFVFNGTATVCTSTCASFASLDVGTTISGTWSIDVGPNGTWDFSSLEVIDIVIDSNADGTLDPATETETGVFAALVQAPAGAPIEPYDGTNPTTANPLPLTTAIGPIVAEDTAPGGPDDLFTAGTTDANGELNSGTILHQFVVPPFNSNGAWVIFDIGPGGVATAQVCLFYPVSGCIPGATQTVLINGVFERVPGEIEASPSPVDFGDVDFGVAASQTLTISNTGEGELFISSVDSSGLPAEFTVDDSNCTAAPLPALTGTCTIDIDLLAPNPGALTGDIVIASNDPDAADNPLTVTVNANVVNGTVAVTPNPRMFTQTITGQSTNANVTVTNNGAGTLTIDSVATNDMLDAPFDIAMNGCMVTPVLAAGENCVISLSFSPMMPGVFMDSFDVAVTGDPATASVTVAVEGSAVDDAEPQIAADPTSLTFETLLVGEMSEQVVTIESTGSGDLTINGITVTGAAANDFTATPTGCGTLAPAATCTVNVVFAPTAGGDRVATLTIDSDAINDNMLEVALAGSGFDGPRIEVAMQSATFGSTADPVDIGATISADVTVSSTGTEPLVVTGTPIGGADAADFAVGNNGCDAPVAPGSTCTITVDFSPLSVGDKAATLSIESNDVDMPSVDVALTGFVFEGPRVEPSVAEVEIGSEDAAVEIGMTADANITLSSTGTADLIVSLIEITDDPLEQFSFTDDCTAAPVAAGATCTITVTFAPAAAGVQTATLILNTNDVTRAFSRAPATSIPLTGVGIAPPPPPPPPPPGSQTNTPPAFATGDAGSPGACFIATAAYGSYLDPNVEVLRDFRDDVLLKTKLGSAFVALYYDVSPPIADFIARYEAARLLTRVVLTPLVYAMAYPLPALLVLSAMWWAIRRRRMQAGHA